MIAALLKVMILGLLRDRGALAMVFFLPPLIFVIFAAIFSGVSAATRCVSRSGWSTTSDRMIPCS